MILTFSFFFMLHLSCVRAIIMEMLAVYSIGFLMGIDNAGFPTGIMPAIGGGSPKFGW